ncbi:MAG: sigma-70 family RNA polymerase sigma factor [Planctomycetia bacterium]|nr:sigma-70 family RNA polymerase sigma factor [Planctomycetia bacterium]
MSVATWLGHVLKSAQLSKLAQTSDRELLQQFARQRSEAAFEELIRRHGPLVWGVCQRMLSHRQDSEDAFQAVWLVLARKANGMSSPQHLAAWLFGVARHASLNVRKVRSRRARREIPRDDTMELPDLRPASLNDIRPVVDEELARLPTKYQLPVMLCCLHGMTHQQAAEELHWPIGTVAGRLSRGREMLRQRLNKRGLVVPPALLATLLTREVLAITVPESLIQGTLQQVFNSAGLAGAGLGTIVSNTVQHTLRDITGAHSWNLFTPLAALVLMMSFIGLGWMTLRESNMQPVTLRALSMNRFIEPRTVKLPENPDAIVVKFRQLDSETDDLLVEMLIRASGIVEAHWNDDPFSTLHDQLSEDALQNLMQFLVFEQQFFSKDAGALWGRLKQEYQFDGNQRNPKDRTITEMELTTAEQQHSFTWFQLGSTEVWFHQEPEVQQLSAIYHRLRNQMIILQAGGRARVEHIARLLQSSMQELYPQQPAFSAHHLLGYIPGRDGIPTRWTFTRGNKMTDPHYFSITIDTQNDSTLQVNSVTPGPSNNPPAMKRRQVPPAG